MKMKRDRDSVFQRTAASVRVREIHRRFAFTWNIDTQGNSELALLRHYIQSVGVLGSEPVLLTTAYECDRIGSRAEWLPYGVYYPEKVIGHVLVDGELSEHALHDLNEYDSLDEGTSTGTYELDISNDVITADTSYADLLKLAADRLNRGPLLVLDQSI